MISHCIFSVEWQRLESNFFFLFFFFPSPGFLRIIWPSRPFSFALFVLVSIATNYYSHHLESMRTTAANASKSGGFFLLTRRHGATAIVMWLFHCDSFFSTLQFCVYYILRLLWLESESRGGRNRWVKTRGLLESGTADDWHKMS